MSWDEELQETIIYSIFVVHMFCNLHSSGAVDLVMRTYVSFPYRSVKVPWWTQLIDAFK